MTFSSQVISRRRLLALTVLALASVGFSVGTASAGKPRPPQPTPTPVVVPTVPAPPAVSVSVLGAVNATIVVSENPINYGFEVSARYVSGPLPPPNALGNSSFFISLPGSTVVIQGLVPGSDYVFDLFRVSRNLQPVTSAGTRFSFRTPVDPQKVTLIAPQNVRSRFAASSDTTLIDWDAVPGAATYEYTLDGVNFAQICFNAAYCPPEGEVPPGASLASVSLVGKQFRVRAVGFVPTAGGARPLGPLSAPLSF